VVQLFLLSYYTQLLDEGWDYVSYGSSTRPKHSHRSLYSASRIKTKIQIMDKVERGKDEMWNHFLMAIVFVQEIFPQEPEEKI
jgi:hypothetical protein